jgi:hypothetical protein
MRTAGGIQPRQQQGVRWIFRSDAIPRPRSFASWSSRIAGSGGKYLAVRFGCDPRPGLESARWHGRALYWLIAGVYWATTALYCNGPRRQRAAADHLDRKHGGRPGQGAARG